MNEIICKKSIPYLLMIVFGLMGYFVNHILSPVTLAGTVAAADDQSIQWDRYLETVKDGGTPTGEGETTNNVVIPTTDGSSQQKNVVRNVITTRQDQQEKQTNYGTYTADESKPGYQISVRGFSEDSDANRIVRFRYEQSKGDMAMIQTFACEAGSFNIYAEGQAGEKGLCQLQPNSTNNVWINNPLWNTWEYQAKVCMDKYYAVASKNIRSCYKNRANYRDRFILSPIE